MLSLLERVCSTAQGRGVRPPHLPPSARRGAHPLRSLEARLLAPAWSRLSAQVTSVGNVCPLPTSGSRLPRGSGTLRPSHRSGHAGHLDPPPATLSLQEEGHAPQPEDLSPGPTGQARKRRISHLGVRCPRWPWWRTKPGLAPGQRGEVGPEEGDLWVWRTNLLSEGPPALRTLTIHTLPPANARISAMRCANIRARAGVRGRRGAHAHSGDINRRVRGPNKRGFLGQESRPEDPSTRRALRGPSATKPQEAGKGLGEGSRAELPPGGEPRDEGLLRHHPTGAPQNGRRG